jgi:hypothetical protein
LLLIPVRNFPGLQGRRLFRSFRRPQWTRHFRLPGLAFPSRIPHQMQYGQGADAAFEKSLQVHGQVT